MPHLQDEQTPPAPAKEGTSTHWGDAAELNWAQRMLFDAAGQDYNQDGVPDDGRRSCPLDDGPNSYYYGGSPYDYVSGLADRFHDILHDAEQPLWNGCTTSQLAVVAELDDIDLDYCTCCGEVRYKPTRERNPNRTKTPYAVLRCLPITPRLQRLYASQATAEQMTWHANHQTEEGSMCHPSDAEAWRHFDRTHPDFATEPCNVRLGLCTDGFASHGQEQKRRICEWITRLKFSDDYASNLARYVDMEELRLHGMKRHDYHVFIQKLIPIVFREIFPESVWNALTENKPSRNDDLAMNDIRIQQSIFNFLGQDTDSDFYGILEEVIQLDYPLIPKMQIVLFKYCWVDPVRGMKVHPRYHLVDVNFKKVYQKNELFILAQQVIQVYYIEHPSMKRDKVDWMAVYKIKARRVVDESSWTGVAFQEDVPIPTPQVLTDDHNYALMTQMVYS
ncbi:UNVERIFIED_CONTAM: hypothetical protein Slati_2759700 [Sesamum latifolium]|uniref:DUF4216 domain-containing protein n=1 Tax=Sesamum latifolium TaxID=2727402 RepID=A0AAW2VX57_9LAMI